MNKLALDHVLDVEGGYSNDAADSGGPTNFGITQADLSAYLGHPASIEEVKGMSPGIAAAIYQKHYWEPASLDAIKSGKVQVALFDQIVNRGIAGGIKLAQGVCVTLGKEVAQDGVMGPKTAAAINSIQEDFFVRAYIQAAQLAYVGIVTNKASQIVFLKGWLRRTHVLWDRVTLIPLAEPTTGPQHVEPAPPLEESHAPSGSGVHPAPTREAAIKRYGTISSGVWDGESEWITSVPIDEELGRIWLVDGKEKLSRIRCNKDMVAPLKQAIQNMKDRGLVHELKSFDGCFNIRNVRGSSNVSCHAYGLAIDLNCDTNPLGGKSSLSAEFVKAWKDAGFSWGGDFQSRKDPMHFSFAWE